VTSSCDTCVVATGRRHRASGPSGHSLLGGRWKYKPRQPVCSSSESTPRSLEIRPFFGAVLECSRANCRLFPRRTDRDVELWTRQDRPRSSGSTTWLSGEKNRTFLSYRSPYGTFFVSGLTPPAESFSSPGLLEDSAHWTIAELCRNSSTPCEVGPRLKG
jgi:hypothetical protein